jgi:hypothetical protein
MEARQGQHFVPICILAQADHALFVQIRRFVRQLLLAELGFWKLLQDRLVQRLLINVKIWVLEVELLLQLVRLVKNVLL